MKSLKQLQSLEGKSVLITGAAGHIGLKVAETFAELGARLVLCDRDGDSLERVENHLKGLWLSCDVNHFVCDLENEDARMELSKYTCRQKDGIYAFVHCAAFVGTSSLDGWIGSMKSQTLETWRRAFEVNLTSAFHLSQLLSDSLTLSNGSITLFSSIYGVLGPDYSLYESTQMGNPAAYAASKGGLVQLTRWLATTMSPHVRVNCISPGGVARDQDPEFSEKYRLRTPLARMADEDDFKGVVALLSTEAGGYITGQNIMVDGGWSVW